MHEDRGGQRPQPPGVADGHEPDHASDSVHGHGHGHGDGDGYGHGHVRAHGHDHGGLVVEDDAGNLDARFRVDALQALLVRRGILSAGEVALEIQAIEAPGTPLGARIVARAWTDAAFRERLLANGKDGAAELGIKVGEAQLLVVPNAPGVHNLVVCTLCSCYPRSILGQPPSWYVSKAYRARAVREPARVLEEFGLALPERTAIHVHDSNADLRYLVLPMRPPGTEGLDEQALARWVSRDAMIGVALPTAPTAAPDPAA
jgi:nitrile hydratase